MNMSMSMMSIILSLNFSASLDNLLLTHDEEESSEMAYPWFT